MGTITLTGPAPSGGSTITLVSSDSSVDVPSTVFIPEGETIGDFQVTTSPVLIILGSTIEALFGDCPGVTVNLTVDPAELVDLVLAPNSIGLFGSTTGTVTISGPAPEGGLAVDLAPALPLLFNVPTQVTIAEGETSADFPVQALLGALTSNISASLNGVTLNSLLTILGL